MDKIIRRANSAHVSNQKPATMALRREDAPSSRAYPETPPPAPPIPVSAVAQTDNAPSIAPSSSKRRGSLTGFLQRATSHEVPITRSNTSATGGRTMLRKKQRDQEEMLRQQRLASQVPKQPPQIPSPSPIPSMEGFGGGNRPDSIAMFSGRVHEHQYHAGNASNNSKPVNNFSRPGYVAHSSSNNSLNTSAPRVPMSSSPSVRRAAHAPDPYATTESMTNRGRESYASLALSSGGHVNSPRRVRRKKDPTPFNILIIGAEKSGKTSFIEFLKTSLALPSQQRSKSHSPVREEVHPDAAFTPSYLETEFDGERVGLTLWDSKSLEKNIVDLQLREMASFIESKFEDTFTEEQKVMRSPGAKDTHIHCVLLILDPARLDNEAAAAAMAKKQLNGTVQALDEELDLQVLRALSGKTTVIPIISKADTLTAAHMTSLKRSVWSNIQAAKLDPLEALGLEEEEEESDQDDDSEEPSSNEDISSSDISLPIQSPLPIMKAHDTLPGAYDDDESSLIDNLVDRGSSPSNTSQTTPGTSPVSAVNMKPIRAHTPNTAAIRTSTPTRVISMAMSTNGGDEVYIPFSILSPDPYTLPATLTRIFPWGEADPLNPLHCDFARLRESVFGEWRTELAGASREKWYESWRTSRLKRTPGGGLGRVGTGRIRQAGGVTPADVVPRGGRMSPVSNRKTSGGHVSTAPAAGHAFDHGHGQHENQERDREMDRERARLGSNSGKAEKILGSPRGVAI